jgi:hypothetical protein
MLVSRDFFPRTTIGAVCQLAYRDLGQYAVVSAATGRHSGVSTHEAAVAEPQG